MIELRNVSKYYHNNGTTNLGLHNISLKMNKGEIIAITGDSGSGKSTLLNVITKIDTFDDGEIYYKGNETSYFSVLEMDDFRKNKIGFIFQSYNIIDSYTVLENVMLPLTLKGVNKKEARQKATELINKVGLSHRIKSRGTKLSGGEKQRCVIARALASDCEILACDEPTGNLDSQTGDEIIKLIKEVAKDKLVLIVTHNYEQVEDIVTRKIRVSDGEITEDIVIKEVEDDPDEELNLDYVPLKKKVCVNVAKNNIVFTPRKTILLILIFLAIWVSSLFMYQAISNAFLSETNQSAYQNALSSRVLAYNTDHSAISDDILAKYDYDKNSFYEDASLTLSVSNSVNVISATYSTRYKYNVIYGEVKNGANDVTLILPKDSYYLYYYDDSLDEETITIGDTKFNITAVATTKETDTPVITNNDTARNIMLYELVKNNLTLTTNDYVSKLYGYYATDITDKKPYIVLPSELKNTSYSLMIYNIYDVSNVFEIKYTDKSGEIGFYYSGDCEDIMPTFEASIYGNTSNIKKYLNGKGVNADICSKVTNTTALMKFLQNLYSYLIMLFASQALIIVFFITYVILSKVYQSKKKDYQILRTLGVTRKDMKHIVDLEVISTGMFAVILSYAIFMIMLYTIPNLKGLGTMQIGTTIIYFLLSLFFTYLLARRFNRRLFKFSVTKSLKGDGK